MNDAMNILQSALVWSALAIIIPFVVALTTMSCRCTLWRITKKFATSKITTCVLVAFSFLCMSYGGSKGYKDLSITWDTGLSDDYTLITNAIPPCAEYPEGVELETNELNVLIVKWSKAVYVPDFSTVTFYGLARNNPEGEMVPLFTCSVTNLTYPVLMPSAVTNFVYFMENSYIPDAPTRTNGVYHIDAAFVDGGETIAESPFTGKAIPLGTTVKADGTQIVPEEGTPGEFVRQYIEPSGNRSITTETINTNQEGTER